MYTAPNVPYGYGKSRSTKTLKIVIGAIVVIGVIVLGVYFSLSQGGQDKYTKSATAAAREKDPNAEVRNVKVASGFALATVSDPTAEGQENTGNMTVFKVNKDGSMTQLATGSSFSPIDLLGLGMPLATQAKLTGHSLTQVQQNLAGTCGYGGGDAPGYIGFDGSFDPGGWQIDAATLDGLEQALTNVVGNDNAGLNNDQKVVCVSATRNKSNATTDKQTYISTFTLELQFITGGGKITDHIFTFATGPNYYRNYTLDGQKIQAS